MKRCLSTRRVPLDEDVPAFGKNYCPTCSRYFVTPLALTTHEKTKDHKRRWPPCLMFFLLRLFAAAVTDAPVTDAPTAVWHSSPKLRCIVALLGISPGAAPDHF